MRYHNFSVTLSNAYSRYKSTIKTNICVLSDQKISIKNKKKNDLDVNGYELCVTESKNIVRNDYENNTK